LHQIYINWLPLARQSQKGVVPNSSFVPGACVRTVVSWSGRGLRRLALWRKDSSFALWQWTIIP
jgi:hypothetical protein